MHRNMAVSKVINDRERESRKCKKSLCTSCQEDESGLLAEIVFSPVDLNAFVVLVFGTKLVFVDFCRSD